MSDDGGPAGRVSVPLELVGAVGIGALDEVAVEDDFAVGRELGKPRLGSPSDEHMPVREHLHVALTRRKEVLRVRVRVYERYPSPPEVDVQQECPRLLLDPRPGPVVEERDRRRATPTSVVLPRERRPGAHIEGAPVRNQSAIAASRIMQPNDDVGMKGQIGLPQRW